MNFFCIIVLVPPVQVATIWELVMFYHEVPVEVL